MKSNRDRLHVGADALRWRVHGVALAGVLPSSVEIVLENCRQEARSSGSRRRPAWVSSLGEAVISRLWDAGDRWLPGQLLGALAHGGTSSSSYAHALGTVILYATIAAGGAIALFQRRDA